MHIHSEMHAFLRMTECMFARALMFDWHWHRPFQAGSGRPSASEGAVAWWLPWEAGERFLPISLCGVIVFDSPSRPLLLPSSSSSSARPPFVTQTLSHTIFHTHNNFVTHNLSHNSYFTHNLSHNNFVTHNLSHNNFITHTTLSHTIFHTTSLSLCVAGMAFGDIDANTQTSTQPLSHTPHSHATLNTQTSTHNAFTQLFHTNFNTALSHATSSHTSLPRTWTHTTLSHANCRTRLFHTQPFTQNSFTQLFHTLPFTHTTLSHTTLSHKIFPCHTQCFHTHTHATLSHTAPLSHTVLSHNLCSTIS